MTENICIITLAILMKRWLKPKKYKSRPPGEDWADVYQSVRPLEVCEKEALP